MRSAEPAQVSQVTPRRDEHGCAIKVSRRIGRTKGGLNTKLDAICDSQRRPLNLFVTDGRISDQIGARVLISCPPNVDRLLGDRHHDDDRFRDMLKDTGISTGLHFLSCRELSRQVTIKVPYRSFIVAWREVAGRRVARTERRLHFLQLLAVLAIYLVP